MLVNTVSLYRDIDHTLSINLETTCATILSILISWYLSVVSNEYRVNHTQ
ncbi:hypothetical protein [Nostoc sp.]